MKFSAKILSAALAIASATATAAASSTSSTESNTNSNSHSNHGLPSHHPPVRVLHPTLAKFSPQFRCPYAQEWLAKGAHKAAMDLGLTTTTTSTGKEPNPTTTHRSSSPDERRRRALQAQAAAATATTVMGSCAYDNVWSVSESDKRACMEFRGEGWTPNGMDERCKNEPNNLVSTNGQGCAFPETPQLAGWCVKESGFVSATATATESSASASAMVEASAMMVSGASDCNGNKMACETFVGGSWQAAAACGGGTSTSTASPDGTGTANHAGGFDYTMGPPSGAGGGDNTCLLAPGAIGAAHQAGFSKGYSATCPGTPAEGSPYMWPMAWSANIETQSMPFGSDEIMWHSKGRTFYRLDKNWKRTDTTYSNGILRTIGQGPCADINPQESANGVIGCNQNSDFGSGVDPLTTMIHKGSKMYFITWKNTTEVKVGETNPELIEECNHMDLMVVGNIRPDWFLDDRGDDTDVQYLGDQHVYYASGGNGNGNDNGGLVPRLVKQWRKKDFASQYFTMSVTGNPHRKKKLVVEGATTDSSAGAEGESIHWPLILNIPGEGFGDDMLQVYQNHALLSDDDDDLFRLVENLEQSGAGSCSLITGFGDEGNGNEQGFGPSSLEVSVPSNLEVDPNSWVSSVYTFSPVWEPPAPAAAADESSWSSSSTNVAVTEEGRVRVESCYDPSSRSVELTVEWLDVATPMAGGSSAPLPWVALGYLTSEVCSMNPPDGSESKIIVVHESPSETVPKAYAGSLHPGSKGLDFVFAMIVFGLRVRLYTGYALPQVFTRIVTNTVRSLLSLCCVVAIVFGLRV